MDEIILTDNGKIVLAFMQHNDKVYVGKDLGDLTNVKGIYPVLTSLIKKDLVSPAESIVRDFTNSKGETKPKEYKTYQLTENGRNYIIK